MELITPCYTLLVTDAYMKAASKEDGWAVFSAWEHVIPVNGYDATVEARMYMAFDDLYISSPDADFFVIFSLQKGEDSANDRLISEVILTDGRCNLVFPSTVIKGQFAKVAWELLKQGIPDEG